MRRARSRRSDGLRSVHAGTQAGEGRQRGVGHDPTLHQRRLPLSRERLVPFVVDAGVQVEVFVRHLQGPVWGRVRCVGEEGPAFRSRRADGLEQLVGVVLGREEIVRQLDLLPVFEVGRGAATEDRGAVAEVARPADPRSVGAVEAPRARPRFGRAAQMPLAGHRRQVARLAQQSRQRDHPVTHEAQVLRTANLFAGRVAGHGAEAGRVGLSSREQHGPGG